MLSRSITTASPTVQSGRTPRPRARPAFPASLAALDLRQLDAAHRRLLRRYAAILAHSMSLPFFVERASTPLRVVGAAWFTSAGAGKYFALRPLVRPLVESHMDRRLGQLDRIYLYVGDFVQDTSPIAAWIEEIRENLAVHRAQLRAWTNWTSLARLLGVPALGVVVGLVGAISGDTLLVIATWVLFLVFYVGVLGGFSFMYKRSLLLGEPGLLAPVEGEDQNAYRAEDELWGLLGLSKTKEPGLDLVFFAVPFLANGVAGLIGNLTQGRIALALVSTLVVVPGIGFLLAIRHRDWR